MDAEVWWFIATVVVVILLFIVGSYWLDGRLKEHAAEKMRELLQEERDNRVREIQMGWGEGVDPEGTHPEGINPDDEDSPDCEDED